MSVRALFPLMRMTVFGVIPPIIPAAPPSIVVVVVTVTSAATDALQSAATATVATHRFINNLRGDRSRTVERTRQGRPALGAHALGGRADHNLSGRNRVFRPDRGSRRPAS